MPIDAKLSSTPASITGARPRRRIREPVTKEGANMPTTWAEMTNAASA